METTFKRWKPIEIMLAVLFLLAPFYYHPNIGGEGLRIPNNITVWMMATIIITYSLHLVLKRPTFVVPKYFIYFAAFPILITLSGFVTGVEQPMQWLFRLLFIWGGLAFFFSLFQHGLKQGRLDRILFVIVISTLLHASVGIAQIWFQAHFPFWLPTSRSGASSGFFQQINNQATYQVTAIMMAIYLTTRPCVFLGRKWVQGIIVLALLTASLLVVISNSTIGILTLLISLLILITALWQRLKINKQLSQIAMAAIIIGAIIGYNLDSGNAMDADNALEAGYGTVLDKTDALRAGYSGAARLGIYSISFDLIKQQPLAGYGIGSFGRVWQHSKPAFYAAHPDAILPAEFLGHPHNEILFWLVEGGILTGIAFVVLLVGILISLSKLGGARGGAYFAMLLPLILHTQIELPFYTSAIHWFLLLTILMMINNQQLSYGENKLSRGMNVSLKGLNIIIFSASSVFLMNCAMSAVDFMNNKTDSKPLEYAKYNPYYREDIEWLSMGGLMYSNMASGNRDNVKYAIDWAEKYALYKPTRHVHYILMDAYEYLGLKAKYCEVVIQWWAMYPTDLALHPRDTRLQQAKRTCLK